MKKLFIVLVFAVSGFSAAGQQIFVEDFDLSIAPDTWDVYPGLNGASPLFTSGGLTYPGYSTFSGASDGAMMLSQFTGNDTGGRVHAAAYKLGTNVYTGFLVSISAATVSDNLAFNLIGSPDVTLSSYGFVLKDNGSGSLKFGLKVNAASTYAAANYAYNTTYLVVVKYNASTKVYSLFINPSLAVEPAATLTAAAHTGLAPAFISQVQVNQFPGVTGKVDGIRVVRQWSDLLILSTVPLITESFETTNTDIVSHGWTPVICCGFAANTPTLSASFIGSGRAAYASNAQNGVSAKTFSPAVSSGMIYASFIFDEDANAVNTTYSNFNFFDSSNPTWSQQQGFVMDDDFLSLKNGSLATNVTNGPVATVPRFLVLGYNTSTGQYSLWVNPTLGTTTPPAATITATSSVITSVSGVNIMNMGNDDPIYDEIRVSTTWAEVVASSFPESPRPTNFAVTYNGTDVNGSFTVTSGYSYLVVRGTGGPPIFTPNDGSSYVPGLQGSDRIISVDTAPVFNDSGVSGGEVYFYSVYSFLDVANENYNTQAPAQDIVATEPQSINVPISNTVIGATTIDFTTATIPSNVDGIVVLRSEFTPNVLPFRQAYYTGLTYGNTTVAYVGSVNTFSDTGLTPNTTYSYRVFTFIGTSTYVNLQSSSSSHSYNTFKAEPTAQPVSLSYTTRTSSSIAPAWLSGGGDEDGYLLLYRAGTSPTTAPTDGVSYSPGNSLGTATVGFLGSSTNASISGLASGTEYFFDIYAYTKTSDNNAYNYRQLLPLEGSVFTLASNPGTPGSLNFLTTTNTSFTASFSPNGATTYLVLRATSAPNTDPVPGTSYPTATILGNATVIYNGSTASFTDTGLTPATTYFYKIFAVNGTATSSNYSLSALSGNRVTAPANLVVNHPILVTQTSFTASWISTPTSTSYRLDVSTSNTFSSFLSGYNNLTVAGTSASVTGLTAATTYYYRARAVSATGTSEHSNVEPVITAPANPTATAASSITQASFNLNWNLAPEADAYFIDVSTVNTFASYVAQNVSVGNVLTYNIGTLTAGTTYYYQVRAANHGTSGSSNVVSVTTVPPNPVPLAGSAMTGTSFNANWATAVTAIGYELDVSTVNTFTSYVAGYNSLPVPGGSTASKAVTGLTGGTLYYYKVRATSGSGTSGDSGTITVLTTPPSPVAGAATSVSSNEFTATWAAATSATSYRLDVATTNTFNAGTFVTGYQNLNVNGATTAAVSGLADGTTYYYQVRGVNASGTSVSSNVITTITAPPIPVLSATTQIGQFKFNANWSAAPTATGYRLDVSTDPLFGTFVGTYNNLSVGNVIISTFTSGVPGTTYYYRMRATSASGASGSSPTISVTLIPPNPLIGLPDLIAQSSFRANWTASTSASSYRLDVATNSAFTAGTFVSGYQDINVNNVTSFSVGSTLAPGTTYFYRVRAVNASGTSQSSSIGTMTTSPPDPVAVAATAFSQTTFTANWNASTTATEYFIDVSTDGDFINFAPGYNDLSVGNALTLIVDNSSLTPGTVFFYRVKASSISGVSGSSNVIQTITIPANPVATTAGPHEPGAFVANWEAVTGATSYRLDVATDDNFTAFVADYEDVDVSNVNAYNVNTNLIAGTQYYYRVQSVNASGISSESNFIGTITLADAPLATVATSPTEGSFVANWNPSGSATSYAIDVSSNGFETLTGAYDNKDVGSGSSAIITGLSGGVTYSYRIRAVNASGQSTDSNIIEQITVPNAPLIAAASGITTSSFNANWDVSVGADSYRLDVSTDEFVTFLSGFDDMVVSATQASVTGLIEGVEYKYRVRAVNTAGTSASSSVVSVITVPPIPIILPPTEVTTVSFKANWSVTDGATEYLLDVSPDDFTTFLPGFNNKSTTNASETLAGLQPNTQYKYRVRATSSSGTSVNSDVIAVTTYALAPVAISATAPSQTAFTANWNVVDGISSYQLDVSEDDFVTRVTDYDNLAVSSNSKVITGLDPAVAYKYRVRSVNITGASANSNTINVITIPATPVAVGASAVSQTGLTANWNTVAGADSYVLDLSTSDTFESFVTGYDSKVVSTNSAIITGLASGTVHYYRVRSKNETAESPSSNQIEQITVPAKPTFRDAPIFTTNTSFLAEWKPVEGADFYELDVTLFDSNFATFLDGYQSHKVDGTVANVVGLSKGVAYKFRVRAVNNAGISNNSDVRGLQATGAEDAYSVTAIPSSPTFTGGSFSVSGEVKQNIGVTTATMSYSGLTGGPISRKVVNVVSGDYSIPIDDNMVDELGMQFVVTAEDEVGKKVNSTTQKIYRSFNIASSPVFLEGSFTGDRSSIRIISIPYDLGDNQIESIFNPTLGSYDKKKWRLAHYSDGANIENADKLFKIDRGLGYWFNASGNVGPIRTGAASAPKNDSTTSFVLSLAQGWNQIGNPFPFAIDWSDVLADVDNAGSGVGSLKIYSQSKKNFDNGNHLEVFTGGFVHADNAATLHLKVSLKKSADGSRVQSPEPNLGGDAWELSLSLKQGSSEYDIAGIGMDPAASSDKDAFDEIRLPRLDEYLDITFEHSQSTFKYFTKDIQPTQNEATWEFFVQSSGKDEPGTLQWNNSQFGDNFAKIFLLDVSSLQMTDMRSVDHYAFDNPGRKEFKIYFSKDGHDINPDLLRAGAPYPNPSTGTISMLVATPNGGDAELVAFDMLGRQIHSVKRTLPGGIQEMSWEGSDNFGNRVKGLYVLRARVNNNWIDQSYRVVVE